MQCWGAVAVSSVVLFNTQGVIDRGSVEKLSLAMKTASSIAYMSSSDDQRKENQEVAGAEDGDGEGLLERPTLVWTLQVRQPAL